MVMLANELHPSKAFPPMTVTESGMVTIFTASLSTPHSSHELYLIVVVPSGMLKCPPLLMLVLMLVLKLAMVFIVLLINSNNYFNFSDFCLKYVIIR